MYSDSLRNLDVARREGFGHSRLRRRGDKLRQGAERKTSRVCGSGYIIRGIAEGCAGCMPSNFQISKKGLFCAFQGDPDQPNAKF